MLEWYAAQLCNAAAKRHHSFLPCPRYFKKVTLTPAGASRSRGRPVTAKVAGNPKWAALQVPVTFARELLVRTGLTDLCRVSLDVGAGALRRSYGELRPNARNGPGAAAWRWSTAEVVDGRPSQGSRVSAR